MQAHVGGLIVHTSTSLPSAPLLKRDLRLGVLAELSLSEPLLRSVAKQAQSAFY